MARLQVADLSVYAAGALLGDVSIAVDYNANNGHVNGLFVSNGTGRAVYGEARFDAPVQGQTTWGQNFPAGDTLMSLPAGAVSVVTVTYGSGDTGPGLSPEAAISVSTSTR